MSHDLRALRNRRRLVEQLAAEWEPERRLPEHGLLSLLADVQAAVEAVVAEAEPRPAGLLPPGGNGNE